jgi:tRNA threonylcarbamoyladenosine biosynthesis protein TsaB
MVPTLLLAVDTSGRNGSLALARTISGESEIDVLGVVPLAGGAFSAELVPQIALLLEKHKHSKNDLGAFAVSTGPGSFTGLRVGLAAIKGLAEVTEKPIAAVSLLEAVACGGTSRGRVLAVLDAGRGDVYVGEYETEPGIYTRAQMHSERLLSRVEFLAEVSRGAAPSKMVITPDASLAEAFQASGLALEKIKHPDAAITARIGWDHLQRGLVVRPEDLEANYLRHSDAEIFSKPTS